MPRLVLLPSVGEFDAPLGASLLAAVNRAGAPLGQSCRGRGVCRACVVTVISGAEHLGEPTPKEQAWLVEPGERLACQARVRGREAGLEIQIHSPHWGPLTPSPQPDPPG